MQVIDVIADILKKEGIHTFFGYPTTPVIEALAKAGMRPILCRQERVGVDMANGYARINRGKPFGVFAMQYGPGAENAFSGIASAYSDSAPVLLLPLGHRREIAQVHPSFRSSRAMESVTRSAEELLLADETPNVMRRAINQLRNGRVGPALIELALDLVDQEIDYSSEHYRPVRQTRSAGDSRDIDEAAAMLLAAKRPVIQAGQGVLYADASAALLELAELADIPVYTTLEGKSAFPENHPLALGTASSVQTGHGKQVIDDADVVFSIGSSLTRHLLVTRVFGVREKRIIHATNDARDLNKGYETEIGILGDCELVLRQLIEAVRDRLGSKPRQTGIRERIKTLKAEWLGQWQHKLESTETPITPYRVISEFSRVMNADDAIVTHESGSPRDQITPFYESTLPHSYIGWGKSHALGSSIGLTIGAKLAAPEKFCVNFMGDAAFGMTGLDFETAVRTGTPICTVVMNNSTMAIEKTHMELSHSLHRTRDIGGSYANIGRDLGGWSERVEDPAQIGPAFERAMEQNRQGKAALIEFITSEETEFSFKRSSLAT
ncbi:MAG: thiamine pyrophosphate-requiring protein [Burkholderiaceae bacterium]